MSVLLNISHLNWAIGDKHILEDISFSIKKGEVLGIIGPNGAGKTSLLNCLLNQQKNISGTIHFKGKDLASYSMRELAKHFAVVVQKTAPVFDLNVYDIVSMGLLPHKTMFALDNDHDRHQIELALKRVGLSKEITTSFNTLSGGEQQRVLIARALVQQAQVLILDEPTNHLDVYYQHQILQLVKALHITVIMTVHDLNLAAVYCQRLILLNQGKIIADDSPDKVLTPKVLTPVFRLECQRETDPVTGAARIYFHLPESTFQDSKTINKQSTKQGIPPLAREVNNNA